MDYEAGKQDWLAWGLPYEGKADLVGRHLEELGLPTCAPDEPVAACAARLDGFDEALVLGGGLVVVGAMRAADLAAPGAGDDRHVAAVMRTDVTTVRPAEEVDDLADRMRHRGVDDILVTRSDGTLLGVFRPDRRRGA